MKRRVIKGQKGTSGDMIYVKPFYVESHGIKTSPTPRAGYVLHPAFKRIRRRWDRRAAGRFGHRRKGRREVGAVYVGAYCKCREPEE